MKSFDGTDAIQLLPFLKNIRIIFKAQHLTEGVAIRVFAHFLEWDPERLYTSYTLRGLRAGQLHDDTSRPALLNQFIKRYLTDDVLGAAFDAVASARQLPHEIESTFADRLESAAFQCTAVFSEQALAHYFVRGLSTATRAAVAETVQRLRRQQKTELSTTRRIATAEGTTYRARRGLPLPDRKPAAKGVRIARWHGTSSPATTLRIRDGEWQANPVLITQGYDRGGGRPPTPASAGSTRSFATADAHTPKTWVVRTTTWRNSTSPVEKEIACSLACLNSPTRTHTMPYSTAMPSWAFRHSEIVFISHWIIQGVV